MALSAMVADCCVFVGALEWIQKYIHILKWTWRCCGKRVVLDTLNLVSFVVLRLICFGLQGLAMFHSCLTPWTKYETTLTWFHFWGGGCQIMVLRSDVEHLLRAGKALRKQRCLNFSWLEETCHDRWSRSDPKWMGVVHHFVVCLRHCWNDCYLHWGENPLHWCGGWLLKWSMGLTLGIQWSWHFKRAVDGANKTCANGLTKTAWLSHDGLIGAQNADAVTESLKTSHGDMTWRWGCVCHAVKKSLADVDWPSLPSLLSSKTCTPEVSFVDMWAGDCRAGVIGEGESLPAVEATLKTSLTSEELSRVHKLKNLESL